MSSVEQRQNIENIRIYERNIPSAPLQPYLDVRPVNTKYSYLPIVDPRKKLHVPMNQLPTYNQQTVFNPGQPQGPWSGFATEVNTESILRNQVFALQKCSQAAYVPNTNSDMYTYSFQSQTVAQPHELLFEKDKFKCFNPNPNKNIVGNGLFFNSTRSQMKDVSGVQE